MSVGMALALAGLIANLVSWALVWYYKRKLSDTRASLTGLMEAGAAWKALHDMQVKQLGALQRALADRHIKESADDKELATKASGDARAASDLLNSLHKGGSSGRAGGPARVQPTTPASLPGSPIKTLR